jgi:hypothetical protein
MLKRIPKSDISIRPFKAYKEWSFDNSDSRITMLEANETSSVLSGLYPQNSIYGQLRAQFYYDSGDNIFLRSGHKQSIYTNSKLAKERFLSGSAKVISIPNIYVGEGIKKGSVVLVDNESQLNEISYVDDSFGNLQDNRDQINISRIDMGEEFPGTQPAIINFIDLDENVYSASLELYAFDIQFGTLDLIYNGIPRETINLISLDIETGMAIAEDIPFLPEQAQGIKIGNVFYNQGLIVITKDAASRLENGWQLDYKSTKTIYEHEYLLIANEDEFNVSQNPSAVVEVGKVTEFITGSDNKIYKVTTNPGTKYIKKKSVLETGEILDYRFASNYTSSVSGGFEHYDLSGSIDSTGSFLAPFITTIGLYDDNCDLVAVAKLPQPIKSEPDMPVNFIIRFDT